MSQKPDTDRASEARDADAELMQAFAAGNEAAFVELYQRYRNRIWNFCRRMLPASALAEEATQETFLKLYRARTSYSPKSRFSTYLYKIAQNHCFNLRARQSERAPRVEVDEQTERPSYPGGRDPARLFEVGELRGALKGALAALSDNQRAAVILCHYDGLSQREAADVLGVSESALKALVHRGKESLLRALESYVNDVRETGEQLGAEHVAS